MYVAHTRLPENSYTYPTFIVLYLANTRSSRLVALYLVSSRHNTYIYYLVNTADRVTFFISCVFMLLA